MELKRYPSAALFLAAVGDYLLESEAENSVIFGIARALADAPRVGPFVPYFAAVHGGSGPVMAAFSSLARRIGVTQTAHPAAIPLLVKDVREACPHIRDIGGPEPTSGEFAAQFAALTGKRYPRRMATRIHQLDVVQPLARVAPGRLRAAAEADVPRLVAWVDTFHREIGEDAVPEQIVSARMQASQLFVWDHNGPVSMAAWTGKTPNGVRVNMVFTPEELRGQGYASACVAALSQQLLDDGNGFCCLYTDLANPTSNAIYARIGYRPVCDAAMYTVATTT